MLFRITRIFVFLMTTILNIQTQTYLHLNSKPNENSSTKKTNTFLNLGIGLAKAYQLQGDLFQNNNYRFLFNASIDFGLFSNCLLSIGASIHETELGRRGTNLNVNLMPSLKIVAIKNRLTLTFGAGETTAFIFGDQLNLLFGLLFSIKTQYLINDKYCVGLEVSHPNYLGVEYTNYLLFRNNMFIAIRL